MNISPRSIIGVCASITVAAALCVAPSVTASAAPIDGAPIITIGDSFTATTPFVGGPSCVHPTKSWPTELGRITGTPELRDVSCNGGALDTGDGWTLVHQVRAAAADGGLGAGTKAIFIQMGLNDSWGDSAGRAFPSVDCLLDLVRGCGLDAADDGRVPDYRAVTGAAYADRIRTSVNYLRFYAPNAKVVLVGYPEIFPAGATAACMNLLGNRISQPRAEGWITFIDRLDAAQRDAAAELGIDYADARAVTAGHGSCADDSWIGGVRTPDELSSGAPIHPTAPGNTALATALADRFL